MKKITKTTGILLVAVAVLSMLSGALAYLWVTRTVDFTFSLAKNGDIQVYSDAECTTVLTSYDWGEFTDAQTKTLDVYVKNIGNIFQNVSWYIDTATYTSWSEHATILNRYDCKDTESNVEWSLLGYYMNGTRENWTIDGNNFAEDRPLNPDEVLHAQFDLTEVYADAELSGYTVSISITGSHDTHSP